MSKPIGAGADFSNTVRFVESETDSANSKATTIQAVESPSVGAESSETSELQVDDSAVLQEVHRQSSIQEGESSAILSSQPTTCGSKSEDPVTPRRKDEKDQLSQLLSCTQWRTDEADPLRRKRSVRCKSDKSPGSRCQQ